MAQNHSRQLPSATNSEQGVELSICADKEQLFTSDLEAGEKFRQRGFIRFTPTEALSEAAGMRNAFKELVNEFATLPPDPYAKEPGRYRRYGHAILLPWTGHLDWVPPIVKNDGEAQAEYYQGGFNPEHPGIKRLFPSITLDSCQNLLLDQLIWGDFKRTFWDEHEKTLPIHVGVHFVKLSVCSGLEAISSPNVLHRDGEAFTFAHLIVKSNVIGGVNFIAPPKCAGFRPEELSAASIIAQFELDGPLDSYAVHDSQVSHFVSGIRQMECEHSAERGVVLIDFNAMASAL